MSIRNTLSIITFGLLILPSLVRADAGGSGAGLDPGEDYNPQPVCENINSCVCLGELAGSKISRTLDEITSEACLSKCQMAGYNPDLTSWTCPQSSTNTVAVKTEKKDFIVPILNVPIPGLCQGDNGENCFDNVGGYIDEEGVVHTNLLGVYVSAWYKFLLIAASIVAVTMLAVAGIQYATAGGNTKQVEQAKKRIWNAVTGMILLLLAYNIAFFVDPKTTTFKPLSIKSVPKIPLANKFPPSEGIICTSDDYLNTSNTWQQCMLKEFGKSPGDINFLTIDFFGKPIEVNALIADRLYAVIDDIQAESKINPEVANYNISAEIGEGSAFVWRCNTTDKSILSYHSWGMALDINPSKNPYCLNTSSGLTCVPAGKCETLCTSSKPTDIPQRIIDIFKEHGFDWGGNWPSLKDYMHFQAKTICDGGEIGKQ